MSSSREVLTLYRQMLRQSAKFAAYNFRNYAFRKTRDEFVRNRFETDPTRISNFIKEARVSLKMLQRQGTISQMYAMPDLVVEK